MKIGKRPFSGLPFLDFDAMEHPLEDTQHDILHKALAMHGFTDRDLPGDPARFGLFLQRSLGLDPTAYHGIPSYEPKATLPGGLTRHVFPYAYGTVNIWTLATPVGLAVIDTGCTPAQFAEATEGTEPAAVFITHDHGDHNGGLSAARCPVYGEGRLHAPSEWGGWHVHPVDLAGHTAHSRGYVFARPGDTLFFTGDALFAGSIGNTPCDPASAIRRLRHALASLPDDTVICPGHGPATTKELEEKFNPFLTGKPGA